LGEVGIPDGFSGKLLGEARILDDFSNKLSSEAKISNNVLDMLSGIPASLDSLLKKLWLHLTASKEAVASLNSF
jgi:hypothetical protein